MTKGKNKKMKATKIYLFLLPPLPSQDGGGFVATPPPSPTFSWKKKFLKNIFIDTWYQDKGWLKLTVWQS